MANLRANKITTGTADYQGSIYASGTNAYLITTTTAPGTDDFTIECWINSDNASGTYQDGIFAINAQTVASGGFQSSASNQLRLAQGRDGTDGQNGGLEVKLDGTVVGTPDGEDIIQEGTWHHVAVTRASGTVKIWVDGVEKASGSAAGDITGTTFATAYYDGNYTYQGYMSNFRYRKGTAHYTTTFTPPTGPLERTSDTELLFAQSVNNAGEGYSSAIHGGTTNIMQVIGNVTANTSAPTLTTSSSVGAVFEGDTKVNTQGYMYFPTGSTEQRVKVNNNFGARGLVMGGITYPGAGYKNTIEYITIASLGNSVDFGDLTNSPNGGAGFSSKIRGFVAGGNTPEGYGINVIQYVTIATLGNATDFGDVGYTRSNGSGVSNNTRGVYAGGESASSPNPSLNNIEYITMSTTGNGQDFGDLIDAASTMHSASSPTRGLYLGGYRDGEVNFIDFLTIATTGNSQDFGDLLNTARNGNGGASNGHRGVVMGGYSSPARTNVIQYVTIQSTGNAIDFGDLTDARDPGVFSSLTRGVACSGDYPSNVNIIDFIEIMTTANAVDFGDMLTKTSSPQTCSNAHGGLADDM